MKRFIYNGLILTFTSLFIRIISMFFNVYITNTVGSETLGVFHIIMSVYLLGITFATSGVSLACTKIISEEIAKNNEEQISNITNQCLKFSIYISIITGSIIILGKQYITKTWLFNKVSSQVLIYIGIALPFIAMSSVIDGYFLANKKVYKSAIVDIFEVLVRILSTIILFKKFGVINIQYSCLFLIIGDMISEIASFSLLYLLYIYDIKKIKENKKSYTKKILSICTPIAISSYIRSGLSTLKQILIPIMLERSGIVLQMAMSLYGTINGMVFPIILFPNFIIMAFSSLLIPEFTQISVRNDYLDMSKKINKILRYTLTFSTFILGIFIFMANDISYTLYKSYDASTYIRILSPLIIFMYLDNIVDSILKGLNKQVIVMIINIIDLVLSILCIILIIPIFGIKGYIFTICFSTILNSTLSIREIKKCVKYEIIEKRYIIEILTKNILCWTIYLIISRFCINLIQKILIYLIIYATIYYIKEMKIYFLKISTNVGR